jgi:Exostosin family
VPLRVYLARSHTWLRDMLLEAAELDRDTALVEARGEADVVIYLTPPWPDPSAPDHLARLRLRDLQRIYVFSQSDFPFPWAPGMYASLPASRARAGTVGGFYVAPNHRGDDMLTDELEAARGARRDLLWSFVGTMSNAAVRRRLGEVADPESVVRNTQHFSDHVRWNRDASNPERREAHRTYAETLGRSMFVACPRGRGPGSMRLFEAMQAGRCPVILSDDWLAPPFVDWSSCSIQVPEARVRELPAILRARTDDADRLGRAAREVWEEYFSPERQLPTLIRAAAGTPVVTRDRLVDLAAALLHEETARSAYRWARKRVRTAFGFRDLKRADT